VEPLRFLSSMPSRSLDSSEAIDHEKPALGEREDFDARISDQRHR
jgi:hypothetical protein